MTTVQTLQGDNTDTLPTIAPASVQCVVTSPPYFGLRDYGIPPTVWPAIEYVPMAGLAPITIPAMTCCLGLEADPLSYVAHLVHVFRLMRPALKGDGVAWLNLGDSYCAIPGSAQGATSQRVGRTNVGKQKSAGVPSGLKEKDLIGIPWRAAYALQADGWYLRSDVIWAKPNAMPESVTDRPTKAHEYIFLLAKSARYYYDADAIRESYAREYSDGPAFGGLANRANTKHSVIGNHGGGPNAKINPLGRNRRSVWTVSTQSYPDAHYAVFPEALIEPCILAGSKPGDTVLDPYGGSGTTARVSIKHNRSAILCEINPDYIEQQAQRTNNVQRSLLGLEAA